MAMSRSPSTFSRPEDVLSRLAKEPVSPLYLFHGDEGYFIDQAVRQVKRRMPKVEDDLKTEFNTPARNMRADHAAELMSSEHSIPGVSDGGAHTKFVTIGAYPTDMITWMVRDAGFMSLEEAHYRLSALPAQCAGFHGRGVLQEGAPADIVVYDLENLKITPEKPKIVHDFPGNEWRRVQYAEGYRWIMVNGEVTFRDGECTNATPGQLLRHGK